MSGEFPADTVEEVVAAIARFFGERPPYVEAEGFGCAAVATPGAAGALAA